MGSSPFLLPHGNRSRVVVGLQALCMSLPAQAAIDWRLGADVQSFDYRETVDGRLLDQETGWLPGLIADLEWNHGLWSLIPEVAWYRGQVDYDGQTQAGQPHQTDTDTQLLHFGLAAAYRLPIEPGQWRLTAGVHRRQWDREIRAHDGVAGLNEYYRWYEGSLGLQLELPDDTRGPWQLQLQYLRILAPELKATPSGYDPLRLDLGEQHGWRAGIRLPLWQTVSGQWSLEPYWERWRFGRSDPRPLTQNGVPTGWLVVEPDSLSNHWGLRLSYRFDG